MKTVLLLLSTDRFSIPLIRYLVLEGKRYGWRTCIGSMFDNTFVPRIREEKVSSDLIFIHITDFRQCDQAIAKSDIVIGMMPDIMLLEVADRCIKHRKPLVSPSRLNRQLFAKKSKAEENEVLVLAECGFTPGLDHITAKKMIDNIHIKGGEIVSFKTYSGSLISESSIDNPWEFKLTETVSDLFSVGKGNNRHVIKGHLQHVPYPALFNRATPATFGAIRNMAVIPEDDALYCRKVYGLTEAHTVLKGRIMREGFASLWDLIIRLGLTNSTSKIEMFEERSCVNFLRSILPYTESQSIEEGLKINFGASDRDIEKLRWLGLFEDEWPEGYKEITPAVLLQHLLEQKFTMRSHDKDSIILCHDVEYRLKDVYHYFKATLVVQGEDERNSATAKAIGLTAGAAAKGILLENIKVKGLHTPVKKEIYDPILNELDDLGVAFHVEEKKTYSDVEKSVEEEVNY
jgi:saccharopine dehydrogenase-like NADP-dependent oxidoreductase